METTLEKMLQDVMHLAAEGNFVTAAKRLGELRIRLERHLDIEGRLVPVFVVRTGDPDRLAYRLKDEHEEVLRRLDEACAVITRGNAESSLAELGRLTRALEAHDATEARLIHPALDDLVPENVDWHALHHQLLTSGKP